MGLSCVQCGNKVGLFKKPVEGLYCSAACRDVADADEERARVEARALASVAPESAPAPEAAAAAAPPAPSSMLPDSAPPPGLPLSGVVPTGAAEAPCPKCTHTWLVEPGAGSMGRHRGTCRWCGFGADFVAIDTCPNCRGGSLIVQEPGNARCARCKIRPEHWGATG